MKTIVLATVFLIACGGGAAVTQKPADLPTTVTTTATPVAPSPPLFTGSFDVVSMTDPATSKGFVVADMIKQQMSAHDGRMSFAFAADSFTIGFWQAGELEKLASSDKGNDRFSTFCSATGTVSSHWEGNTIVLGSAIKAEGRAVTLRVVKSQGSSQAASSSKKCSASFAATRITFEIVEKDDAGPTKLRGKAEGVVVDLVRGKTANDVVVDKLFD